MTTSRPTGSRTVSGTSSFIAFGAAIAAAAALIAGCGGGATVQYRQMAEGYGLHRALHQAFVRDGESVELQVSDPQGRPVRGLVLTIVAEGEPIRLVSDGSGRLAFPVSSRLLGANPEIEIERPAGVAHFNMTLNFSIRDACARGTPPALAQLERDFERGPFQDFGPDRVYFELGVAPEAVKIAGQYLAHARALFVELTGAPPPPIGVAFAHADRSTTGTQDRAGRTIWPVSESRVVDGLLVVVHEWTHAVMQRLLPGARNDRSRYLEDGLCELISHLTDERVSATRGSPVAAGRADELVDFAKQPSYDLLALGTQFSSANGLTLFDQVAAMCNDGQVTIGYGLGLAFWLEQLDRDPGVVQHVFSDLRQTERPGAQAFISAADTLSQPHGAMRNLDVSRALQTLRAHEPNTLAP